MKIGVLALQGAFAEHIAILRQLKVEALPVRLPTELNGLDGERQSVQPGRSDYVTLLVFWSMDLPAGPAAYP